MPGVRRLTPAQALARVEAGARLVDVRSSDEQAAGMAVGAEAIAQDALLEDAAAHLPRDAGIVLICQRGVRSLRVAEAMMAQGFADIASIEGGTDAWRRDGLPMSAATLDADFLERYSRQWRLPQVGIEGQRTLRRARVAMIGAGGLGAPAAFYLAAAGIGHLRLIDDDVVDRSNLQRQILHVDAGVGHAAKVDSARERLLALNPSIEVEALRTRVDAGNVDALIADADVVFDGGDNFPVRQVLNDACLRFGKPLVYGAVQRFEGQASVFDAGRRRGQAPCYRCLFPEAADDAPNCAEAGVLGVVPGIIGLVQATETLKLILGIGEPLVGRLLRFDALTMRFRETRLMVDPDCPACGSLAMGEK
ncbi:molybdopterin-synthase adenylyltransferase MoeB [Lysobacter pythonis]|uniref:Molybdopterin-synthase adenylyltransferase n=1 Tax=Solilutibacter pythonis TaxID=2483112 RepID=A0A3M2I5M9_9GAMM|nr:molybdopterin-synthase adenylyltransferase MoeB [Lysobacter pythonis]RMH94849.1 molybdopterin-synthase adenylyltransferase MoeB [Lysobacter pythonis]